jgi:mono/diheme cytochrome c family protein
MGFLLGPGVLPAAAPPRQHDPSEQALAVLRTHCTTCHGGESRAKGGFGYVLDRDRLVARGQVVPGRAADSPLWQRITAGEMPPATKPRLSVAEQAALRDWIDAGAPSPSRAAVPLPANETEVIRLLQADLHSLEPRQRRFVRYLTLSHLATGGATPAELETHRQALDKLVNSLSWHPRLHPLLAIDPGRTLLRLDLRWYRWNARVWDRLVAKYPYRPAEPGEGSRALATLTGGEQPWVRGDWFVATASRPPFYHDFLQLSSTDRGLERLLQIDTRANIDDEDVLRSGFNGSGVARNNRLLERHDAPHGAYWRSYDFSDNLGRQNLFERPLGPAPGPQGFSQAGGEVIFHLPNGLFGFLLVDGDGRRVDKAPGDIVSDPKRPDRLVENGVSCLGCHSSGLILKDDQVRAHVQKNPAAFSREARETVLALYPPAARFKARLDQDNERFRSALHALKIPPGDPEPVTTVVLRFEGVLDLRTAAAELGCGPEELAARLQKDADRMRALGPLLARGTVQRQVFEEAFPQLARPVAPQPVPVASTGWVFRGHRGAVRTLAWAPDGRLVASGGEDRTVRLIEVANGREARVLEGHRDEVEAIAFSADGRKLLTAGRDRVVLLHEVATGRLLARLQGHTDAVRAVAFLSGGRAVSAGADQSVRLWDLEKGREISAWIGHRGPVNALAVSGDGSRLLSAGNDRQIVLWELPTGRILARWDGHTGAVQSLAFSADGRRALSGSSDRTIRLQEVATGKTLATGNGAPGTVCCVRFSADGRQAFSASSRVEPPEQGLHRWDLTTGRALGRSGGERLEAAAFSPDGRQVLVAAGGEVRVEPVP